MTKPKDPEVIEEMRAAGRVPKDEETPAETDSAVGRESEAEADSEGEGETDIGAHDDQDGTAEGETEFDDAYGAGEIDHEAEGHPAADYHADEASHRSLAATALMILLGIIAVAAGTLWAAPRVAPHLPAGIAQYLMPGQMNTADEIATLRQKLTEETSRNGEQITAMESQLASAQESLGRLANRLDALPDSEALETKAAEALDLAREANAQVATLARRADAAETELVRLRESLGAVNEALAGGGSGGDAAPAELSAAVASLNKRVDSLAAAVANRTELQMLEERIDGFATQLDDLEASAANARSVQNKALGKVSDAIHQASLRSAVAALTSHVESGQPYAGPLGEVTALTGTTAPKALAAKAAAGLASPSALGASFGSYAQAAIAADVQAESSADTGSQVLGWLRAQVIGRPITEQEGESVGATTSRIAARVDEGALSEALAEAETLPPHAQAALGSWLDQLRARVEAEKALHAWLSEIGVNG